MKKVIQMVIAGIVALCSFAMLAMASEYNQNERLEIRIDIEELRAKVSKLTKIGTNITNDLSDLSYGILNIEEGVSEDALPIIHPQLTEFHLKVEKIENALKKLNSELQDLSDIVASRHSIPPLVRSDDFRASLTDQPGSD